MEGLLFNRHVVKANHLGLFDDEVGRRPGLKRYTFQKKSLGICNYQDRKIFGQGKQLEIVRWRRHP